MLDDVEKHIDMLVSLDDETYDDMTYPEVKTFIEDDVQSLVSLGSKATEKLCSLLQNPYAWSCLFSLKALKEVKDPQAISPLIDFIKSNEDNLGCVETAMLALSNIGSEAIEPVMQAINTDFKKHRYNSFLVGSLTKIIDPNVYSFMEEITEDFVSHPQKYADWFQIDDFTYDFVEQGNKVILPLLNKILQMEDLGKWQRIELQDTIKALDDPKGFEKEFENDKKQIEEDLKSLDFTDIVADEEFDSDINEHITHDNSSFIENTAIYTLVNDKKDQIKIEEGNRDQYLPLLFSIETSIANEYNHDSSLKDRDVIFILKHIRDHLFKKEYYPKTNLEKIIINNLKLALTGNDYSKFEVKAGVKYVYNSVKRHKKVDGKQGYVKFISSILGEQ